ncbi:WD repeat-containing protein 81-like [Haliotis rufescens]|uniref:WD repeat-containing protein 81-like n=1 Tax=Haliotis rufescens TaxID=6454 RepID=UPI00201EFA4A|nr:WD repeat-containing protein 81-like [Haliotis rufescens]
MDLLSVVSERLSLPRHHIGCLSKTRVVCIVSHDWLKHLNHGKVPSLQGLDVLGQAEAEQYLAASCIKFSKPWKKITIKIIRKTQERVSRLRDGPLYPTSVAKSLFEHLSNVSQENVRNIWLDSYKKFRGPKLQMDMTATESFSSLLKQYMWRFKPNVYIDLDNPSSTPGTGDTDRDDKLTDHNVLPITVFLESSEHMFLIHPFIPFTLCNIISYSPAIFNSSHMLTLFLLYQILQTMKAFHEKGLSVGDIAMQNILLDSKFWLYVTAPQIHSLRSSYLRGGRQEDVVETISESKTLATVSKSSIFSSSLTEKLLGSSTPKIEKGKKNGSKMSKQYGSPGCDVIQTSGLQQLSSLHSPIDQQGAPLCPEGERYWTEASAFLSSCQYRQYEVNDLPRIVDDWTNRRITNFKYLMILNHLAGRKMGDPNNHPVLPWIMDFTSSNGGFRDLSMSKFRLNKGDSQLDFTYNMMPALSDDGDQVPHHVSDVLSDITYYVYKARRTSKTILCAHVRTKWVPHEYPSSLQRLQEWTPDECIPEFYTDPTLFASIHEDLPDLEIPHWSSSTQDFIIKHISALESEKVSEDLHHWVDLTFGYKLSGAASVKAKNVYLQLVDQHRSMSNHGVVQLFSQPHPHRLPLATVFQKHPPKVTRNMIQSQMIIGQGFFSDPNEAAGLHEPSSMGSFDMLDQLRPEAACIQLPRDFCPHAELDYMEAQLAFCNRTLQQISDTGNIKEPGAKDTELPCIVSEDMVKFSCLMCEMFLSSRLRMKDTYVSLTRRYDKIMQLAASDFSELPRPLHKAVHNLIHRVQKKPHPFHQGESTFKFPSVTKNGLPPPTPALLLQSYTGLLPFPTYFSELYKCLCQLKQKDAEADHIQFSNKLPSEKASLLKHKEREKVPVLEQFLLKYQGKLGKEGLELLLPYIEELFQQETTTVQAAWSFFGVISKELGPLDTAKRFLPYLTSLYTGENSTAKHVKLYHRNFLMQLMVRLGLKTFLSNFSTLLVEAVAGYKDFPLPSKYYQEELIEEMQREAELSERTAVWSEGTNQKSDNVATTNGLSGEGYLDDESSQSWDVGRDESTQGDVDDIEEEFPDNILLNEDDCGTEESKKKLSTDSVSIGQVSSLSDESGDGESNGMGIDTCDRTSINSAYNLLDRAREKTSSTTESDAWSVGENVEDNAPVFESFSPILDTDDVPNGSKFDSGNGEDSIDSAYDRRQDDDASDQTDLTIDVSDQMVRSETEDILANLSVASPAEIVNIRDISAESVKWLSNKLGPVLTAKFLSRNLVRMLALCFLGLEQLDEYTDPAQKNLQSSRLVTGDSHALKVLECLGYVTLVYGEHVILVQYLPTIVDMVAVAQRRLTQRSESGLFGGVVLLRYIIPFLSVKSLMDNLDDTIVMDSLLPVIKLVTSPTITFPGGVRARSILCHKVIDVLYVIGLRLGLEMTRKHLSSSMLKLFEAFSVIHGNSSSPPNGQIYKSGSLSPTGITLGGSETSEESYLNIKMDPSSQEYKIGTPISASGFSGYMSKLSKKAPSNKFHSLTSLGAIDDKDDVVDYKPSTKEGGLQELAAVFTPELALAAYIPLCRIFGSIHMEEHLPNDDLIRQLCSQQDTVMDQMAEMQENTAVTKSVSEGMECDDTSVTGAIGSNVQMIGNRIQLSHEVRETSPELNQFGRGYRASGILRIHPDELRCEEMEHSRQRHLRGNWLAYWEHELGLHERDTIFNFKQIKLQTFQGHTNSIRSLFVMDNENCFISASKDKTVKLWSLTSSGDGSGKMSFQWSYSQHKKSVFSVAYLDSVRQVASCDSSVHIWDPFTGVNIVQLESSKYAPVVALTALPAPSTLVVTATTEATLRFLDLRVSKYAHEFKCSVGSTGLIRCLTVSHDGSWVAVGFSTGVISLLDISSGILMGSWKAHDGEILQIKAYSKNKLVSSSFDQTMKVWNIEDGRELCALKGPSEPVHCVCFYKNQVLSATTANRIGVHTSVDDSASFTSTKLRSDTFKGVLTSMATLPLNRSLLLGADNGSIRLLC